MNRIRLSNQRNTKIIAHRGGNLEIENTVGSFISSANRGYYGIETDVHKTKDSKFIIYHDDKTARLTESDVRIEETDFETLRNIRFKSYRNRPQRKDIVMPSLEEYIDICVYYEKISVLEIKNPMKKEDIVKIYDIFKQANYLDKTIFISFNFKNLVNLKEIDPNVTVQYLIKTQDDGFYDRLKRHDFDMELLEEKNNGDYHLAMLDVLTHYGMDIDVDYRPIDKKFVKECKKRGIKINLWTVNDPNRAKEFIKWGVDYITSDCLE